MLSDDFDKVSFLRGVKGLGPGAGQAIVHIGLDKTGTSTIQQCCLNFASTLRESRLHYPKSKGMGQFSHVSFAAAHGFQWNSEADRVSSTQAGEHLAEPLAPEREALLLSTEAFCYYVSPLSIMRLKEWLNANGYWQIKIIVYLRNQVDWLVSLYSEAIRWGEKLDLAKFYQKSHRRTSFSRFLDEWVQVFGRDALVVRSYDMAAAALLDDFADAVGIAGPVRQKIAAYRPKFSNYSTPQVISAYMRDLDCQLVGADFYDFIVSRCSTINPKYLPSLFKQVIWPLPKAFLADLPKLQVENAAIEAEFGVVMYPLQERVDAYMARVQPMTPSAIRDAAQLMMTELAFSAAKPPV